jgi:tetratricopeptide (TPR) repeat protein
LAISQTKAKDFTGAEAAYQKAIALAPDSARYHFSYGGFLAAQNRFDQAALLLEKTTQLDPDFADGHLRLGVAYEKLQDLPRAARAWENGLLRAPHNADLRVRLAWLLATSPDASLLNADRAAELVTELVAAQPDHRRGREALAAAYARQGKFEPAIQIIEKLERERLDGMMQDRVQRAGMHYRSGKPYTDFFP